MKQPENSLNVFMGHGYEDYGVYYVDVLCDPEEGGYCNAGVGLGETRKQALLNAAKRLKRLSNEATRRANKLKDQ